MKKNKLLRLCVILFVFVLTSVFIGRSCSVMAEGYGITMSPMNQNIVVDPGESQSVSFSISNPASATKDLNYRLSIEPFYIGDGGGIAYKEEGDSGKMVDWIKFDVPTEGKLAPNETKRIIINVAVPEDAPAGGQYVAVIVTIVDDEKNDINENNIGDDSGISINEVKRMAHLVYAEVTGNTIKSGEIFNASVPGLLFSGKITGSSTVKNTGNVHGEAKYKLQVYPLFSSEEVYTNEEDPDVKKILPDRSVYRELAWEETPSIGIFNVVYTVEFEGASAQVKKMVIVCPLWLLFIVLFVIIALILWIFVKARNRKKESNRSEEK